MRGYYSPYADGATRCSWTRGAHRCNGKSIGTIIRENADLRKESGAYGMCGWHALNLWEERPVAFGA